LAASERRREERCPVVCRRERYALLSRRRAGTALASVLAVCLLLGVLAGCGPGKATIKVTVKDGAGGALANIAVSAGGVSATTDASGVATLKDVAPGQVTVKLSGGGISEEKIETVKAGDNTLAYTVSPGIGAMRSTDELQSMRLRMRYESVSADTAVLEGEVVKGQGAKWRIDDVEIIAIGSAVYIRPSGHKWEKFDGEVGQLMADAYISLAEVYVTEFNTFDTRFASAMAGVTAKWLAREEANGYNCNVFEVKWVIGPDTFTYKLHVIASGEFANYMTRYTWNRGDSEKFQMDVDNLNKPVELKAPI